MVTSNNITSNVEIVGIVSWGNGCAKENFPGSYTNVKMYKAFIESTIKSGECSRPDIRYRNRDRRFKERNLQEELDPDCKGNPEKHILAKCNKVAPTVNGTEPVTPLKGDNDNVKGSENTSVAGTLNTVEMTTKSENAIEEVEPTKLIIPHEVANSTKPVRPLEVFSPTQLAMTISEAISTTNVITASPKITITYTQVTANDTESPTTLHINTGPRGTSYMIVTKETPLFATTMELSSSPSYSNIPGNRTTGGVRKTI